MAFIIMLLSFSGISMVLKRDRENEQNKVNIFKTDKDTTIQVQEDKGEDEEEIPKAYEYINPEGKTLETRINTPEGFERISASEYSFQEFTRNLTLKTVDSPVMLYDNTEKSNQSAHTAVFDLEMVTGDLQQCADSIMRIYAEYFYSIGAYDKIQFHLTNGFLMDYIKWRDGNRIKVSGNNVNWTKTAAYNTSYETFRKYLTQVFVYAGTLSLQEESTPIKLSELSQGDMFIHGGSPGHCVLVIDMAENKQGEKCFLLAQGYMPAQDFHILKNPSHEDNPWYHISEQSFSLHTPEYTFQEGSLRRWGEGFR